VRKYVERIVDGFSVDEMERSVREQGAYAKKIREKISSLLAVYSRDVFRKWLTQGRIICKESYKMKPVIHPLHPIKAIDKMLYSAEYDDMNDFERRAAFDIGSADSVLWWHRNHEGDEFKINGFINHYPDFIVMTKRGFVVAVETKGSHLANEDSALKLALGNDWAASAGSKYKYFMVFDGAPINGAYRYDEFLDLLKGM
ncbi:MAG: hypothetical protein ACI4OA_04405, partial [Selenomonadaceae bacterium]